MKYICAPSAVLDRYTLTDTTPISLYDRDANVSSVGTHITAACKRLGLAPAPRAWDFLSIALAVIAVDSGSGRSDSADGWTRQLAVTIAVGDPQFWIQQKQILEQALCFLTGDIWQISFIGEGANFDLSAKRKTQEAKAITLLSGGLDSLIGSIDFTEQGIHLLAVSQISRGDKEKQSHFTQTVAPGMVHFQINPNAKGPEISQRSRSFAFIAFGTLAATALDRYNQGDVKLYIPENGIISLNIPLTPLRIGSLSTRTTHPFFIAQLQNILDAAGLRVKLENPYQFKTKGEMLLGCRNQNLLMSLAAQSTSCGRFARYYKHCGKCLPCLIRRASFLKWGQRDVTEYRFQLSQAVTAPEKFDDARSAAMAIEYVRRNNLDKWIGGSLNTLQIGNIIPYRNLIQRGLTELETFLIHEHVL